MAGLFKLNHAFQNLKFQLPQVLLNCETKRVVDERNFIILVLLLSQLFLGHGLKIIFFLLTKIN